MSNEVVKVPGWAKILGILGVVFGLCGVLAASTTFLTGIIFETESQYVESWNDTVDELDDEDLKPGMYIEEEYVNSFTGRTEVRKKKIRTENDQKGGKHSLETIKKVLQVPEWYGTWGLINGVIAILLGGGYILCSISLLVLKKGTPRLFTLVIVVSIIRNVLSLILGIIASIYWAAFTIAISLVGLVVDVVFLVVIRNSEKRAYL